jgi:aminoglycoside phosphotransferase
MELTNLESFWTFFNAQAWKRRNLGQHGCEVYRLQAKSDKVSQEFGGVGLM